MSEAGVRRRIRDLFEDADVQAELSEDLRREIKQLSADMESAFCTFVLVGEFNRGKSTLLNALLGTDLLPVDVLPATATINVVRYSPNPLLRVHWDNGVVDEQALTGECLQAFTGESGASSNVQYLEVGLPRPLLGTGAVFVDTPGVNDLNQQRAEVTYRFLPRADVVIFLLDAANAVRRSEMEFLQNAVLSHGIDRIVFVVNFADMLDGDERALAETTVRNRLALALGPGERQLVLLSARDALAARMAGDGDSLRDSGLPLLEASLNRARHDASRVEARNRRYIERSRSIAAKAAQHLAAEIELRRQTETSLECRLDALATLRHERQRRKQRIGEWVEDREREILAIIGRSLDFFHRKLQDDIRELVTDFNGPQFQQFVETRVSGTVRRSAKNWIESHGGMIAKLLGQVQQNLAAAFAREFQTRIEAPTGGYSHNIDAGQLTSFSASAEDVSNSFVKAGLIAGAGAGALTLIGAPMLTPVLAMAGLPLLQRMLLEYQLSEAKAKALPELTASLATAVAAFTNGVQAEVRRQIHELQELAERSYDSRLAAAEQQAQVEIQERRGERRSVQHELDRKRLVCDRLRAIDAALRDMCPEAVTERELIHV